MRGWWAIGIGLAALLGGAAPAQREDAAVRAATAPNPQLSALVGGVRDEGRERPLHMAKLAIGLVVRGAIAETTVTASFDNPGRENVEGNFRFRLPRGSTVTGYALDVNGRMIDGVLVEQPRAREAYEDRVRVRVDPGLAEVSREDVFSTRVFPILPGKGRTIRLSFVTPLSAGEGYALPLSSDGPVGEVTIDVAGDGIFGLRPGEPVLASLRPRLPRLSIPLPLDAAWTQQGDRLSGRYTARDAVLGGTLAVQPSFAAPMLLSTHRSGERFFQIAEGWPVRGAPAAGLAAPKHIRIYWDRSRSRLDDRLAEERALLGRYIAATGATAIDVVAFNSSGATVRSFADRAAVDRYVGGLDYRGATSFAVLDDLPAATADACLLFTDGIATIDARDAFRDRCAVVASAPDADRNFLGRIARAAGAKLVLVDPAAIDEQVAQLRTRVASVIDVRDAAGNALPFAAFDGPSTIGIVGKAPETGAIVVRFAGSGGTPETLRFDVGGVDAPRFDGAGAIWAQQRVSVLAADDLQADAMKRLARDYSVAAPDMAFVVLEQPADYVQAKMDPPGSYPPGDRARYQALRAEADRTAEAEQTGRRDRIAAMWGEQRAWWTATHNPPKPGPRPRPVPGSSADMAMPAPPPPPPPPPPASPPPPVMAPSPSTSSDDGLGEIAVTAQRRQESRQDVPIAVTVVGNERLAGADRADGAAPSRTRIEATPWQPDRPYLATLSAAGGTGFDAAFRAQERLHGALPAFYLDISGWLWRKGQRDQAVEMLLSALDLPTADNGTLAIVAERMVRYGRFDRAVALFERLALLEGHRPQPARSLALALEARAGARTDAAARTDLLRAVTLLNGIVMAPQDGAFDGIELISLNEANTIAAKLRRMGVARTALDPALTAMMDVDVRIVLEWNTDNSDMDLWVDEPTGERAIYNNPNTGIGGQLSNDMTQGFGPEQYLLRRAPNGTYVVSANVYAGDRLNPNGATVVTARMFRDYGRATQQQEIVDIELTPDERGEKLVGRLVVGGGGRR